MQQEQQDMTCSCICLKWSCWEKDTQNLTFGKSNSPCVVGAVHWQCKKIASLCTAVCSIHVPIATGRVTNYRLQYASMLPVFSPPSIIYMSCVYISLVDIIMCPEKIMNTFMLADRFWQLYRCIENLVALRLGKPNSFFYSVTLLCGGTTEGSVNDFSLPIRAVLVQNLKL